MLSGYQGNSLFLDTIKLLERVTCTQDLYFLCPNSFTFPKSLFTRVTPDFAQTLHRPYAAWHLSSSQCNWPFLSYKRCRCPPCLLAVPSLLRKEGLSFPCSLNPLALSEIPNPLHSVHPRWSDSLSSSDLHCAAEYYIHISSPDLYLECSLSHCPLKNSTWVFHRYH